MSSLEAKQAAFLAAVTGTGPVPLGFDRSRIETARIALLHKRAGEVAHAWPAVSASLGAELQPLFLSWAASVPTRGAAYDGHELARAHWSRLDSAARREIARAETVRVFTGDRVRPRGGIGVRLAGGRLHIAVRGRRVL